MKPSHFKDVLIFAALLLVASLCAHSQTQPGGPAQSNYPANVNSASGAPSGNCPGTNVFYLNTANGNFYDCPTPGSSYVLAGNAAGGSGTVGSGNANQLAIYPSSGTAVQGDTTFTDNGTTATYTGTGGLTSSGGPLTSGANGGTAGQIKLFGSSSGSETITANSTGSALTVSGALTGTTFGATTQIALSGSGGQHYAVGTANKDAGGVLTCSSSTVTYTFMTAYTSTPTILVSDETTAGGARVSTKSNTAFTVTCTGASDVVDYTTLGNPN